MFGPALLVFRAKIRKVQVTKGAWIDDEWGVAQIKDTFWHSVVSVGSGIYLCPVGALNATLEETFSE